MVMPTEQLSDEIPTTSAGGVKAARPADQRAGGGAIPTPALHHLLVKPIPQAMASELLVREHYHHSFPGATHLCFGVFCEKRLLGALTLGSAPGHVVGITVAA